MLSFDSDRIVNKFVKTLVKDASTMMTMITQFTRLMAGPRLSGVTITWSILLTAVRGLLLAYCRTET